MTTFSALSQSTVHAPVTYRLFVASLRTGDIVADIPFVGSPRWEHGLNIAGGLTPTVPLGAISKADFDDLCTPWRWAWGLSWGGHVLQCGPVVTDRFNDTEGPPTADVGIGGLFHLFSTKRVLVNPAWTEGANVADPIADTVLTALTLRTIAKRLVQNDLTRVGHDLPIVLPADDAASTHERTYPGYDLAMVGERLLQLTQVIDGPEIEFRPQFADSTQRAIEWEMRIGNPRLGQLGYPHAWDYGQALANVDYDRDGSSMTMAHFERGNGMERGLLTGYQDDKTLVNLASYPWPELETVGGSSTSTVDPEVLQAKADGYVATYARPVVTWSATVRMDGTNGQGGVTRSPSVDLVSAGDNCTFRMRSHRRILDGTYQRRIVRVSNGPSLYTAQLALHPTT